MPIMTIGPLSVREIKVDDDQYLRFGPGAWLKQYGGSYEWVGDTDDLDALFNACDPHHPDFKR